MNVKALASNALAAGMAILGLVEITSSFAYGMESVEFDVSFIKGVVLLNNALLIYCLKR